MDKTTVNIKDFDAPTWASFKAETITRRLKIAEAAQEALTNWTKGGVMENIKEMNADELKTAVNAGNRAAQVESSYRGSRTNFYYFKKFVDSLTLNELKKIREQIPFLKEDGIVYCDVELLKHYTDYRIGVITGQPQEIMAEIIRDFDFWRNSAISFPDVTSEIIIALAKDLLAK